MIFIIMSMLLKIVDVAYGAVTESLEAGVPSDEDFATDLKNAFRQIAHDCYWYCRLQYTLFGTLYTREQPVVTSANFAALEAAGDDEKAALEAELQAGEDALRAEQAKVAAAEEAERVEAEKAAAAEATVARA